jgi:hypothetical protein
MSTFVTFQPIYAAHGIATVPVDAVNKRPLVKAPQRIEIRDSARLALKFRHAGVGFWAGKRNGITVLDVDAGETELADAMARWGESPLVVRSPSGGFHAYYKHNGEARAIRIESKPWDILGSGLVIAPPSRRADSSCYEIIQGSLDDLDRLPVMHAPAIAPKGRRNQELWQHSMRNAHHCDTFDDLLDVARTFNRDACSSPLPDTEVVKIARSAWSYTARGLNRFDRTGAYFPTGEANKLIKSDQDAFILLAFLRVNNGPNATFFIANGLADTLGWRRQRLSATRRRLHAMGAIRRVKSPSQGPAQYRWVRLAKTGHPSSKDP